MFLAFWWLCHVPGEILASFDICHVPGKEALWLPFLPTRWRRVNKYGIVEIPLEDWEVSRLFLQMEQRLLQPSRAKGLKILSLRNLSWQLNFEMNIRRGENRIIMTSQVEGLAVLFTFHVYIFRHFQRCRNAF